MRLLDSNILIYSQLSEYAYLRPFIFDQDSAVSKITQLEVLGFHRLNDEARQYFVSCFQFINLIEINNSIIDRAILLRQQRKMSLGDAIIAATALCYNATIITRNVKDFAEIAHLNVITPFIVNC
ncbi:type II toxin-antitoxin system VapC family toxin [Methylovulum psychrotolerans]|uniref:PIN domain nuclease n=1 Tax=Methylovulum psychrotolerans TaxID=1704499 RepID=A0A1Z4C0W4_9GAMM|nr:type II toxin-antitoxin system VapC family toxin [Methylovulum psychrotolerans]ASF47166.1 PIN domain nuclease [Methylovulum psychrotolerans]